MTALVGGPLSGQVVDVARLQNWNGLPAEVWVCAPVVDAQGCVLGWGEPVPMPGPWWQYRRARDGTYVFGGGRRAGL